MIKSVLKKIQKVFIPRSEFETQTSLLHKKNMTYKESESTKPSPGVPAPVQTPVDPWFNNVSPETIKTEKQITHEEMLEEAARREEENRKKETKEPKNIHQMMYEIATKNWNTVAETQGGSENFQEGPSGWTSGTGMGQFNK